LIVEPGKDTIEESTPERNVPKDTSAIDLETTLSRTISCVILVASGFEILGYVLNSWFIS
jgi:hypothetical protein